MKMINPVLNLAKTLRERGVPVSTPEIMDALSALALSPGIEAATVKAVLQSALIKDRDFSLCFDQAFAEVFTDSPGDGYPGGLEGEAMDPAPGVGEAAGDGGQGEGRGSGGSRGGGLSGSAHGMTVRNGPARQKQEEKKESGTYKPGERPLMNLSFIAAGSRQKEEMLSLIRDLSKKMAVKKGARKKSGGHRLYFRKLWRGSMGSGGVPLTLAWQERRKNKPRLFIICDLSRSMTPFLPFVLEFVFSYAAAHSTVRVFAFVDSLDEITHRIDPVEVKKSVEKVCSGAKLVRRGLTDYGNAFKGFFKLYRNELTSRTTVIVVGDARNNDFFSGAALLGEIGEICAGIYWLNPENSAYWGMGDSYMNVYAPCCKGVFECRNIDQLRNFMNLLP